MTELKSKFEVVVIGGGPAGLSAARVCGRRGMKTLLVEKSPEPGGQLLWTYNRITNYLDDEPKVGRDIAQALSREAEASSVVVLRGVDVIAADLALKRITTYDGGTYSGDAIVIATGVRRRTLGLSGEEKFGGRGILVSGARDRESVIGQTVVIVGGGDAALENALILGEHA
ncbi:MAG TPA: NAD(P)/FAD-dependent oxidoreductase, partial [Pyrinomonadaceae bacterium]|nr:NAD(P)/FAD-dependent oxidoreductase [Pyrinomonadaceae bacterium]